MPLELGPLPEAMLLEGFRPEGWGDREENCIPLKDKKHQILIQTKSLSSAVCV